MLSTALSTGLQVLLLLLTAWCAFACVRAVDAAQRAFRNDRSRVGALEEQVLKLETRVKQAHARISQQGLRARAEDEDAATPESSDPELQAMLALQQAGPASGRP